MVGFFTVHSVLVYIMRMDIAILHVGLSAPSGV